jgi:hypothetical protein
MNTDSTILAQNAIRLNIGLTAACSTMLFLFPGFMANILTGQENGKSDGIYSASWTQGYTISLIYPLVLQEYSLPQH